jgi:hypothetical protein
MVMVNFSIETNKRCKQKRPGEFPGRLSEWVLSAQVVLGKAMPLQLYCGGRGNGRQGSLGQTKGEYTSKDAYHYFEQKSYSMTICTQLYLPRNVPVQQLVSFTKPQHRASALCLEICLVSGSPRFAHFFSPSWCKK